jgi:heme exporter protein D
MNWPSVGAFLDMGGYAWFVWGSYGLTAGVVVLEVVSLRARRRRAVQEVATAKPATDEASRGLAS